MGSLSPPTKMAMKSMPHYLDQNPPVLNTLHEVLHETGGVILNFVHIRQTNTPANNEEIDILVTVDGREILFDASDKALPAADGTSYALQLDFNTATYTTETGLTDISAALYPFYSVDINVPARGFQLKGHDIRVQIRQTTAIAAGARVRCFCLVETLEAV